LNEEERKRLHLASAITQTVIDTFKSYGLIVKADDTHMGIAFVDAVQNVEIRLETDSDRPKAIP
jgi:hypothetical protein